MADVRVNLTAPGTAEVVEEYIAPPKWAVRLISTNHGKRCKKYPETWHRGGYQTYPYGAEDAMDVWGPMGMGQPHVHSDAHWRKEYNKRKLQEEEELSKKVVRGNLKEEQYRFWNGTIGNMSNVATCRWCRRWCYGPAEMREHQQKTDHNRILAAIYDCARARKLWHCFACRASTRHEHWGIPLCAGNRCRNKWRTAVIADVSQMLLIYAKLAFQQGLLREWLNEDKSEKYNIDPNPKKFNWERADAY